MESADTMITNGSSLHSFRASRARRRVTPLRQRGESGIAGEARARAKRAAEAWAEASTAQSPGVGKQDQNKDPIGFAGGDTNIYAYVGNDPVNRVDPSGTSPESGCWEEELQTWGVCWVGLAGGVCSGGIGAVVAGVACGLQLTLYKTCLEDRMRLDEQKAKIARAQYDCISSGHHPYIDAYGNPQCSGAK